MLQVLQPRPEPVRPVRCTVKEGVLILATGFSMSAELLDVVDENDNVIGRDTRFDIHRSESWHRGIHVILFNNKGEMLLQMRGPGQDKYPNTYDLAVSEHVQSGETYEQAAMRGLREELGISGAEPKRIVHFRMNYGDPYDNTVAVLFRLEYDGEMEMDRKEVASIGFFPVNKIKKMLADNPGKFTYWGREILKWFFGQESELKDIFKIYE